MTLAEFTQPWTYESCAGFALVFSDSIDARLRQLHDVHGTTNLIPVPVRLPDGRLFVCADLLTETKPGGLLHAMWEAADKNVLNAQVEVLPWDEAVALLPPDPPMAP